MKIVDALPPARSATSLGALLARVDWKALLTRGRDGWQHPRRVVETLGIAPGDRVAEIGAGTGYWLPWLSAAVGSAGTVYAVDVEGDRIRKLESLCRKKRLDNVVVVRGHEDDPGLPRATIDLAMTCLTYHHIENRERYFRTLASALSPSGRVVHLDDRHDTPPPIRWVQWGHVSDAEEIVREMARAGYRREAAWDFLPVTSFQVFRPVQRATP